MLAALLLTVPYGSSWLSVVPSSAPPHDHDHAKQQANIRYILFTVHTCAGACAISLVLCHVPLCLLTLYFTLIWSNQVHLTLKDSFTCT